MYDYKPNSHRSKDERNESTTDRKIEKVVSNPVKIKQKSGLSKALDGFLSGDMNSVKSHFVSDLLIPTLKKLVWDAFTDGLDILLYKGDRRDRKDRNTPYVSYSNYSNGSRNDRRPTETRNSRYSFNDISFKTRGEAEEVLDRMGEILDAYPTVRVADFYDLVGVTGEHTDNKYGWSDLSTAEIVRDRDGYYVIKLPRALPIS